MIKWTTVEVTTTSDHLCRQSRALCHGPELGPGNVRVDGGQLAEGGEPAVRARLAIFYRAWNWFPDSQNTLSKSPIFR